MKKIILPIMASFFSMAIIGCTEAGETTGVAAATGGVIGAGLGAIVGSQTGDAGTGLVIGAAAGAGTGALVGNAIEAQEEGIRAQDEAIERQERTIAAQRAELEELRRLNQDSPSNFKNRIKTSLNAPNVGAPKASLSLPKSSAKSNSIQERNIPNTQNRSVPFKSDISDTPDTPVVTAKSNNISAKSFESGDCVQGEQESSKARIATESADKLFHYRRAIRLCPNRADYHNALGEVYLSLGRKDDAKFEFKEALSIEPSNSLAKQNLESISSTGRY